MCSNGREKSSASMMISEQNQQQRRQNQEGEFQTEVAHHSKSSQGNSLSIFQSAEKLPPVEEEDNAGETTKDAAVVNRSNNNYCVDIESDYSESTQSSDVDEDFKEDDFQDRRLVSEIPRVPQTCEVGTHNGLPFPITVGLPSIGDFCVKNSTNVSLENKTIITGNVHISKVVYTNSGNKTEEEIGGDVDDGEKRDSVPSQNSHGSDAPLNINTSQDINKVKQWLITWRWAAIFCSAALMLVAIIVIIVLKLRDNNNKNHSFPSISGPVYPEIPDDSSNNGDVWIHGVRIISREEWLAQPPDRHLVNMRLPVKYVFISHTATEFCYTQSICTKRVRLIQTYHIESNQWSDIAYSFLVGGDGLVYVGRGWEYEGAHTFNWNNISIGISFIGTFNDFVPPKNQLHAAQKLIELGVKEGKIKEDYILLGHRQVSKTLSPGDVLYKIIQTWPHWSPQPYYSSFTISNTTISRINENNTTQTDVSTP